MVLEVKVNEKTSQKKRTICMKNVALHNLGCKVNSYEIEVMQEKLEKNDKKYPVEKVKGCNKKYNEYK